MLSCSEHLAGQHFSDVTAVRNYMSNNITVDNMFADKVVSGMLADFKPSCFPTFAPPCFSSTLKSLSNMLTLPC